MGRLPAVALLVALSASTWAGEWSKYVAPDRSFSIH